MSADVGANTTGVLVSNEDVENPDKWRTRHSESTLGTVCNTYYKLFRNYIATK